MTSRNFALAAAALGAALWAVACAGPAVKDDPVAPAAEVVARVGDRDITLAQVDDVARRGGLQPFQALYDARRRALDELIADALLDREAAAQGISRDELVRREVEQRARQVTDQDVTGFYDQNKDRIGDMTLEQVRPQIEQFLADQFAEMARRQYLVELKERSDIRVTLEPPRVPVTIAANDPIRGPANAKVTIVEYSDFQ